MPIQSPKMEVPGANSTVQGSSVPLVRPHALKWYQRLAASIVYGLIEGVALTQRCRWEHNPEVLKTIRPVIFCIWHNRLPFALIMYRSYVRLKRQPHRMAAIV